MNYRHIFLSLFTFFLLSCFDKKLILVNDQYKHDSYHEANSIIFIGDTQKTNKFQLLSEKNTGIQDSLFKKISNDDPDLIIHLGDLVEFGSSDSDWNEFDKFSDYVDKENVPFFSVLGNHEYHGNDKKALANAGMVVGKVNSSLQAHFEKVGETMAKEWSQKAGSRGAAVLSAYK